MADLILAEEVRDYLIDAEIFSAVESGQVSPPPCRIDPALGMDEIDVPTGGDAAAAIFTGAEIPRPWLEGDFLIERAIEVLVRAESRPRAELVQRQVRGALEEKKGVTMGRLAVDWSKLWRGTQMIHSDEKSVTLSQNFLIAVSVRNLTVA